MKQLLHSLFLDDIRNPEDIRDVNYPDESTYDIQWTIVRSYREFARKLEEHVVGNEQGLPPFDLYSFDYYLSNDTRAATGKDALVYLTFACGDAIVTPRVDRVFFHSSDDEKRAEMKAIWLKEFQVLEPEEKIVVEQSTSFKPIYPYDSPEAREERRKARNKRRNDRKKGR